MYYYCQCVIQREEETFTLNKYSKTNTQTLFESNSKTIDILFDIFPCYPLYKGSEY